MSPRSQRPLYLAPSILTADLGHLARVMSETEAAGADWIHLDVIDGHFAPNITFGPMLVAAIRQMTRLPLDVHLMIDEPSRYIDAFVEAGATSITVHVEACRHLHRTVQQIMDAGCRTGIALNPATSVESVREMIPFVDMVLVMTVNPGFGGQKFIQTSTSKIQRMRGLLDDYNPICDLQVDGGIGPENIRDVVKRGANSIVTGSAVYNSRASIAENIRALRGAMG
jgi:ribulose-phosphate 3-epimerase